MNKAQRQFLDQLGERIPRLFDAIAKGNVKSEFIVGVRTINSRQVRLKLVAEVVDPGSNPLATHGQVRTAKTEAHASRAGNAGAGENSGALSGGSSGSVSSNAGGVPQPIAARPRRRR